MQWINVPTVWNSVQTRLLKFDPATTTNHCLLLKKSKCLNAIHLKNKMCSGAQKDLHALAYFLTYILIKYRIYELEKKPEWLSFAQKRRQDYWKFFGAPTQCASFRFFFGFFLVFGLSCGLLKKKIEKTFEKLVK